MQQADRYQGADSDGAGYDTFDGSEGCCRACFEACVWPDTVRHTTYSG